MFNYYYRIIKTKVYNMNEYITYKTCRVCGSSNLQLILDLGKQPLANNYLVRPTQPEAFYPLRLFCCRDCGLLQLVDIVDPKILFKNYTYYTGFSSNTMKEHFSKLASSIETDFKLTSKDIVVDIGGNDGTFLECLNVPKKINIEPSDKHSYISYRKGIHTYPDFFSSEIARKVVDEQGKAKVITAMNVMAHLDNLHDFMAGIRHLLKYDGIFIAEVHHGLKLLQELEWTNIYHEHLSYFTLAPLNILAYQFGLNIFKVEEIPTQGGSIRVYFGNTAFTGTGYNEVIRKEYNANLYQPTTGLNFTTEVNKNVEELMALLRRLKQQNNRITGYGCPAKTSVLTNYAVLGTSFLDYITDTTPAKQNTYSPGMHIPIISPDKSLKPDYALVFAWNYIDEIVKKEQEYLNDGGKFIVPCPKVRIISKENLYEI
jgi:hypothetical protein